MSFAASWTIRPGAGSRWRSARQRTPPVVPGFTTQPAKLEATIKAIADHGAAFMGANVMYLKGGTKDHFMGFLAKEFPNMVQGYERLYAPRPGSGQAGAYAKPEYVKGVRQMITMLQDRHGLNRRRRQSDDPAIEEKAGASQQPAFDWRND